MVPSLVWLALLALKDDGKPNALASSDMIEIYGCESCMSLLARRAELRYMANRPNNPSPTDMCNTMQGYDHDWRQLCSQVASSLGRFDKWVHLWMDYYGCVCHTLCRLRPRMRARLCHGMQQVDAARFSCASAGATS